jgi:hypothetical protein
MKASDRYEVKGAACMVNGRRLPVANMSVGGFYAVTDKPPIAGQVVSLELVLPHSQLLRMSGQVVWVNDRTLAHMPPGFGIKITNISFVDKLALLGFLRGATVVRPGLRIGEQ